MQSIDSIKKYPYGMSKNLVSEKEEIKCNNVKNNINMIAFNNVTKESMKEHNPS